MTVSAVAYSAINASTRAALDGSRFAVGSSSSRISGSATSARDAHELRLAP
jgi:hypothetical protein